MLHQRPVPGWVAIPVIITLAIFFKPRPPGPPLLPMISRKRRDDEDDRPVIDKA